MPLATLWLLLSLTQLSAGYRTAGGSVVLVYNKDKDQRGTGVIIGQSDHALLILTAEHVVAGGVSIRCRYLTGRGPSVFLERAELLLADSSLDLALIRLTIEGDGPRAIARLQRPKEPLPTTPFLGWAAGADPMGWPKILPERVIGKKLLRLPSGHDRFAWECGRSTEKGRSGGGLFDVKGSLIGICSGVHEEKTYYTHADEIRFWLRRNNFDWLTGSSRPRIPSH